MFTKKTSEQLNQMFELLISMFNVIHMILKLMYTEMTSKPNNRNQGKPRRDRRHNNNKQKSTKNGKCNNKSQKYGKKSNKSFYDDTEASKTYKPHARKNPFKPHPDTNPFKAQPGNKCPKTSQSKTYQQHYQYQEPWNQKPTYSDWDYPE